MLSTFSSGIISNLTSELKGFFLIQSKFRSSISFGVLGKHTSGIIFYMLHKFTIGIRFTFIPNVMVALVHIGDGNVLLHAK